MKNTLNPKESAFRFPISIVFSFFKRSLHNGREFFVRAKLESIAIKPSG